MARKVMEETPPQLFQGRGKSDGSSHLSPADLLAGGRKLCARKQSNQSMSTHQLHTRTRPLAQGAHTATSLARVGTQAHVLLCTPTGCTTHNKQQAASLHIETEKLQQLLTPGSSAACHPAGGPCRCSRGPAHSSGASRWSRRAAQPRSRRRACRWQCRP